MLGKNKQFPHLYNYCANEKIVYFVQAIGDTAVETHGWQPDA